MMCDGVWWVEQVLAEAGPAGLNIVDIAKRIQQQGLRDLRTSRTPEVCRAFNTLHSRSLYFKA
jgi:hypothetical protein